MSCSNHGGDPGGGAGDPGVVTSPENTGRASRRTALKEARKDPSLQGLEEMLGET